MYGMVNKAMQDLIVAQFGEDKWQEIKNKANLHIESFVCMNAYPDEITYRLVDAASEVLDLPSDKLYEAFGDYWITYTAQEGYGEMLKLAGESFVEFLQNIDNLHTRVGLSFTQLQPPRFDCSQITDKSLRLHYWSERKGLAPMVIGLLKGLGKRFDTEVSVSLDKARTNGHTHDEFVIHFKKA